MAFLRCSSARRLKNHTRKVTSDTANRIRLATALISGLTPRRTAENTSIGKVVEPGLTTIRFYQRQVGQEAARMLLQSLEHTGPDAAPVRQTTLGYTLVERGSL